ncbi:MAG: 2,3,4,5-tetrahydropyridine-2,6-dicarboxylate N-succinyltransferase [Alphaproteobacteria bacterium]|jgi:2,3,4,5-tetrahydropyridine-2,6-dicarboxylate N-succinyltransferase|nr:2,3,4,5-tetrahydropyridine-2,6-dicarboxylate N-succinyltransferase [Alphaproteobacteria bacterium]MBT5828416.1 2,3,4,5-tetrahydropyridine-2,6-dicarboxylate N-succinyltransferase [Alphaproteobacteria bacterium]
MQNLETKINNLWDQRENTDFNDIKIKENIDEVASLIDSGALRVCDRINDEWHVNQWVKKAILLSFRTNKMAVIDGGPFINGHAYWYDKVKSKFEGWTEDNFKQANFRAVPNCIVRYGSFIGENVVLMPSFVNLGAYVDSGTMIDTWATVGSCAQIGKNCHISGGAGIGGVLEPLQANPVIIEDNCFVGARSEIAEGVLVETGSVISMGVYLGKSTKIINRETGEITYGRIPPYSVVVPGNLPNKDPNKPGLYCAVIVKQVDAKTRSKTSINELLRD